MESAGRQENAARGRLSLGAVTIGQSPRDDVLGEMRDLLGQVPVLQCGALDGVSPVELLELAPRPGESVLVSRLRDGTEVRLAESRIVPRLQRCIRNLEPQVGLVLVLCTGSLEGLSSARPLLSAGRVLEPLARGLGPRRLGVLTPAVEQRAAQRERWRDVAMEEVVVEAASPYGRQGELEEAASRLAAAGVDLVVMDCIGYTRAMKAVVRRAVACPVLLAVTVLARVAAELLEG
jgi:protein AroM